MYKIDGESVASHFLFSGPLDTIASGSFKVTEEYNNHIKTNIAILDTMVSNLRFNRNKEFFNDLNNLYKAIDSLLTEKAITYTDKDIARITVYMEPDSTQSHKEILIHTPNKIGQMNYNLYLNEISIEKTSEYSFIPLGIAGFITFPILYLIMENDKNAP